MKKISVVVGGFVSAWILLLNPSITVIPFADGNEKDDCKRPPRARPPEDAEVTGLSSDHRSLVVTPREMLKYELHFV